MTEQRSVASLGSRSRVLLTPSDALPGRTSRRLAPVQRTLFDVALVAAFAAHMDAVPLNELAPVPALDGARVAYDGPPAERVTVTVAVRAKAGPSSQRRQHARSRSGVRRRSAHRGHDWLRPAASLRGNATPGVPQSQSSSTTVPPSEAGRTMKPRTVRVPKRWPMCIPTIAPRVPGFTFVAHARHVFGCSASSLRMVTQLIAPHLHLRITRVVVTRSMTRSPTRLPTTKPCGRRARARRVAAVAARVGSLLLRHHRPSLGCWILSK